MPYRKDVGQDENAWSLTVTHYVVSAYRFKNPFYQLHMLVAWHSAERAKNNSFHNVLNIGLRRTSRDAVINS
jgi:hypothetical protein